MKSVHWWASLLSVLTAAGVGLVASEVFEQPTGQGLQSARPLGSVQSAPVQSVAPAIVGPVRIGAWSHIGPIDVGADVASLLKDPVSGALIAASPEGWLYQSSDAANTWQPYFTLHNSTEPRPADDPFKQVEAVRLSDGTRNFVAVNRDDSVVYTKDGQLGWATLERVNRIRAFGDRVYALSKYRGLVISTDGGAGWSSPINGPWTYPFSCYDAARTSKGLIAICEHGYIYQANAGADYHGSYTYLLPWYYFTRDRRLAVSPSNPDVVYASFRADEGNGVYLYQSLDGGTTWSQRSAPTDANSFHAHLLGDFDTECGHEPVTNEDDYVFEVDPANPSVVWLGARELYRSDDGGATFQRASLATGQAASHLPGRVRKLLFSPTYDGVNDRRFYVATPEGVYLTDDASAQLQSVEPNTCDVDSAPSVSWTQRNNGYTAHNFVQAEMRDDGELLATIGQGDSGGLYYGDLTDSTKWHRLSDWHPTAVSIDPVEGLDLFYSNNCGLAKLCRWQWNATSQQWDVTAAQGIDQESTDRVNILVRDPNDRSRLWSNLGTKSLRTDDGMAHVVDRGSGINTEITAGAVSPLDSGFVVLGTSGGVLHHTPWGLEESFGWNSAGPVASVTSLQFDPRNPQRIYATTAHDARWKAQVWTSTDGWNWTGSAISTPQEWNVNRRAYSLAIDPDNNDVLYAGTDDGIFVSVNRSQEPAWLRLDVPFRHTRINKLVFRKGVGGQRMLYAFTQGRGVWAAPVDIQIFSDVPFSHWAYDYISRIYYAGVTKGCASNPQRYCPVTGVTRAEMAVFLLRSTHGKAYQPQAASGVFADVPTSHWAAGWIEQLRTEGVTNGCASDPLRYCPDSPVQRDQMAVFLLRAKYGASYQPPQATGMFADVPTNYWAAAWIEQLAREGITGGCSSSTPKYCPTDTLTRDQMAVFLTRTFGF